MKDENYPIGLEKTLYSNVKLLDGKELLSGANYIAQIVPYVFEEKESYNSYSYHGVSLNQIKTPHSLNNLIFFEDKLKEIESEIKNRQDPKLNLGLNLIKKTTNEKYITKYLKDENQF